MALDDNYRTAFLSILAATEVNTVWNNYHAGTPDIGFQMYEPVYQFVKGRGWVPTVLDVKEVGYREHNGKMYKVSIVRRTLESKDYYRYAGHIDKIENLRWWEEWNGLPAGFGPGGYGSDDLEVITEELK